jgi:hypothetical protein
MAGTFISLVQLAIGIEWAWNEQMGENERLDPGIHDRRYEYLNADIPAPIADGTSFLA